LYAAHLQIIKYPNPQINSIMSQNKYWQSFGEVNDPVNFKKRIEDEFKEELPFVSGAMSTAGGLVFYGNQAGDLKAVDAKTGNVLWQFRMGTGIIQSPVTYSVGGKQYLAVVAGRSKGPPSFFGKIGQRVIDASPEGGILAVFELGS